MRQPVYPPFYFAAIPVLPVRASVPGEADLPVPVALPEGQGRVHLDDGESWLPVALDARLRQVPLGQRHVHHLTVGQKTRDPPEQDIIPLCHQQAADSR